MGAFAIAQGEAAVITLAGGEGTRLGCNGPKGTFPLSLPRQGEGHSPSKPLQRTPFSLQFLKIQKAFHSKAFFWIIFVSPKTKEETISYFRRKLKEGQRIYLIEQEESFCTDFSDNPLYNTDGSPVVAPNGNGGIFKALHAPPTILLHTTTTPPSTTTMLEILQASKIKYLNIISIDNVLVTILNPPMLGFLISNALDVANAAIPIEKDESLGVFVEKDGGVEIEEYINRSGASKDIKTEDNCSLANIANHIITLSFLSSIPPSLPVHRSKKKIKHRYDPSPKTENGYKSEMFIFDGFRESKRVGVYEVSREYEYEGLKNKEGDKESISSCITKMIKKAQSSSWKDNSEMDL